MQIKIGTIGAGIYGRSVLQAFKQAEYEGLAHLIAVADINKDRVKQKLFEI